MMEKRENKKSMKRICPQQKARYLAYTEPSKEVQAWMAACHQRSLSKLAQERKKTWAKNPIQDLDKKLNHNKLIGQLTAADARNRIRQMRLQCQNLKMQEINLMILSQASVQSAVRLEMLLAEEKQRDNADCLDQLQRCRVEEILDDEEGLTIIRR